MEGGCSGTGVLWHGVMLGHGGACACGGCLGMGLMLRHRECLGMGVAARVGGIYLWVCGMLSRGGEMLEHRGCLGVGEVFGHSRGRCLSIEGACAWQRILVLGGRSWSCSGVGARPRGSGGDGGRGGTLSVPGRCPQGWGTCIPGGLPWRGVQAPTALCPPPLDAHS